MQFRIKDQDYFLTFIEEEQRWYLVAPTATSVQKIPVYVDVPRYGHGQAAALGLLS